MNDTTSDAGPSQDTVTLDPENPWLGLFSYSEETRAYFHGRDEESAELARRVQRAILTVLFGQSGLGKTSLLRAGLVPRLRKEGYCPVYVRLDYAPDSPSAAEQIKRAVFRATTAAGHWTRPGASVAGESLWEFLHKRDDLLRDANDHPLIPLLIFDQFEEIFTIGQGDDAGRRRAQQFLEDLADLVENRAPEALEKRLDEDDSAVEQFDFERADYRVLIALREDYLAFLESIKDKMPSITQNRMRLARMNGAQALSAVRKPGGKLVSQEVAEAIVRFVAGGSELANAEIEPSLLSLVCRELNTARLAQGRKEISADLLAGSRDTILTEFYERALADQPEGVRRVVEDELLTESGYRESLAEERVLKALAEAGAAPDALATLVNRRLLRIEERLDVRRVELTHDVLCGVVMASRTQRHAREAKEAAERQLAEQREREAATHRTLVRTRMIAIGCAVLLVLAIIAAGFGFVGMHRANTAEARAAAARSNAEALVGNLMNKFYAEVAPTGQVATLGNLAQMAVDYYDRLPKSQMTTQSQINRGMALIRLGQSQNAADQYKAGAKSLGEAQKLFQTLRDSGNHSEDVTYGLALALYYQGFAVVAETAPAEGGPHPLERAAGLLRPLATAPHASRRVRQTYADALSWLAYDLPYRQAVATAEAARKILAGLGALNLTDLDAATMYAETVETEAADDLALGDNARALQLAKQAYVLAGKVLARSPGNLDALAARSSAASTLSTVAQAQHDAAAATQYAATYRQISEEWVRFDPSDQTAWNFWVASFIQVAYLQFEQGAVRDAIATLQQAMALAHDPRSTSLVLGYLGASVQPVLASWQAEAGDAAAAARTFRGFIRDQKKVVPLLGSEYLTQAVPELESILRARLQLSGRGPEPALATASAALGRVKALTAAAKSPNEIATKYGILNNGLATATSAALRLSRYAQAESLAREWLALVHTTPVAVVSIGYGPTALGVYPLIETPRAEAALAGALAGQGKRDAAAKALQPALAAYAREQQAGAQGTTFRHDYAYALYVKSLTEPTDGPGPKQRKADLAEAAKLIAGASQQAQQLSSYRYLSALIAKAGHAAPAVAIDPHADHPTHHDP